MPLPAPPPLKKTKYRKKATQEAYLASLPPDLLPITFPALEEVFYDKDITKKTGFRCRTCLKFQRCCLSPQQMLQCVAYFLFCPQVSTSPPAAQAQEEEFLATIPLTPHALASLSVQQLLGVYFFPSILLAIPLFVMDITPHGLRSRLLTIAQETLHPDPYLLTTE